ncbi:MAG: AMP-dependent synthetase/ligase [Actinobacteria bacterium]|jgi:long-chain acyl-CoA synthetase|nr:AMP-dependent synthetase/ligase [Actinomycetota bacterium]
MREHREPALVPEPRAKRLTDDVVRHAAERPAVPVMSRRVGGAWVDVSAAAFAQEVASVARGLVAAGVSPGDRVGIMSRTRYEWTVADYAIWWAGGVTVPIYETSSAEQVQWILSDSGAVAVILEADRHRAVFDEVAGDLPAVTSVHVIEQGGLDALRALGEGVADDDLEARRTSRGPDDLATIIYTSGTTGRPKGCSLSHDNFAFEAENIIAATPEIFADPEACTLLFLPLAHVFGRIIQVACVSAGVRMGHAPDPTKLTEDLPGFRPTFLLAVPRVFEKVFNGAQQKAIAAGKGSIFDKAAHTAEEYSRALDTGKVGFGLKAKHALFDRLVYGKLRDALGGRVAWAVSGGAPLGERLGHFYRGIGITILEGYGLTETAGATTVSRPKRIKVGAVGIPFPGAGVAIADDGEVLLAGRQIFQGYWNNPAATAEVLPGDGWFRTGDIGELDADGFLRITGRKKELLVTAGGKNVAPAVLEDRLRAHWLISQCMVVGDNKPFIAALITLDQEALPSWVAQKGKDPSLTPAQLADDPDLLAELQAAVDEANKAVSQAESIRKFTVLGVDWTEAGGQLTPSMKLRRGIVMKEFEQDVEALYH